MASVTQKQLLEKSITNPDEFWGEAAQQIHWVKPYDKVLDSSNEPFYQWFPGGELNTCYNALDVHVENGRGNQAALIYDSPVTDTKKTYTYNELTHDTAKFAGVLSDLGVTKGDRVVIYMPMIPQAVIAILACARIGAIHSVVFGGFAGEELAKRIDDAKPKVIVSASCGIEGKRVIEYKPLLDEAIRVSSHKPDSTVIYQRPQATAELQQGRDNDWVALYDKADAVDPVPVKATDPLYILYTSGTTGTPKGVLRDNGGHAVALKWTMKNIYGLEPGEVFWAASDVGWVVGHSYIVYAPLLNGSTTIVYEGKPIGTPDAGAFWRVIDEHDVSVMFTAPTAIRAIKREDATGEFIKKYKMDKFRALFLAGERCDPDTLEWVSGLLNMPVIDHWWQTETGWAIAANCLGVEQLPIKSGSPTQAVPGYQVEVLDEQGDKKPDGELGSIAIKLPLPPGTLTTLWQNDDRYISSYLSDYDGYYLTGDAGYIDSDGYIWVMGRTDDVINVAGHRLSTGRMEECLAEHPHVAECAVVGVADKLKGQSPLGLIVLKKGVEQEHDEIIKELILAVRNKVGAVAAFKQAAIVSTLPKTRSGKVLRATIRNIADGEDVKVPPTIDDRSSLDVVTEALKSLGYPAHSDS